MLVLVNMNIKTLGIECVMCTDEMNAEVLLVSLTVVWAGHVKALPMAQGTGGMSRLGTHTIIHTQVNMCMHAHRSKNLRNRQGRRKWTVCV